MIPAPMWIIPIHSVWERLMEHFFIILLTLLTVAYVGIKSVTASTKFHTIYIIVIENLFNHFLAIVFTITAHHTSCVHTTYRFIWLSIDIHRCPFGMLYSDFWRKYTQVCHCNGFDTIFMRCFYNISCYI